MSPRTYEEYDVDEYFIIFLRISPVLQYSRDEYYNKKYELQLKLLQKLQSNEITVDELKEKYNKLLKRELKKRQKIAEYKFQAQQLVDEFEKKYKDDLLIAIQNDLDEI